MTSQDKHGHYRQRDGRQFQLCSFLSWLQTDYLTSLSFSYYICRNKGINRTISKVLLALALWILCQGLLYFW